jgi:hypothetical protein
LPCAKRASARRRHISVSSDIQRRGLHLAMEKLEESQKAAAETNVLSVSGFLLNTLGLVRKRGFEPLRSCERQPLRLVSPRN